MKSLALLTVGVLLFSSSAFAEGKFGSLGDSIERSAKEIGHKLGVVRTHPLNETPTPSPLPSVAVSPTPSPSASPITKLKK